MTKSLLTFLALVFVLPVAAPAQTDSSRLTARQLTKAENLVVRLQQFEAAIAAHRESGKHKDRLAELAANAREKVSDLPESNVKTDLATAIYLYELASADGNGLDVSESAASQCAFEKPGAYRNLCESTPGSRRDLLSNKASLHVAWAIAGIVEQRSGRVNSGMLDDMEAERETDRALALRVISALKVLESDVVVHNSLGDFEDSQTLARVPFERFHSDLRKVSADVETILFWLPQNKLKSALGNALHSYQDGGVRWERIYKPRVVNVANLVSPKITPTSSDTAYLSTVPYTVAINWRQGSKYLRLAEEALERTSSASNSELARLH